ncbi:MAG: DUF2723 domain-containing protein [Myxococcales bacterium]|nr:DUF2723 domain-containing protein [Myxococcales bacterium]
MTDTTLDGDDSSLHHGYAETWAAALSWALPLLLAVLSAGDSMGLYDAPELATSAAGLGVTHPPGHPLWVALGGLASLLPLGSVAFRVSLLGGLCLAVMGRLGWGMACAYADALLDRGTPPRSRALVPWMALAMSLSAVLGVAVFRQATRPEVYALSGALTLWVLKLGGSSRDPERRARETVLALGLAASNHTFMAVTMVPVALLTLAAAHGRRLDRWRRFALAALPLGLLGLAPYVLLPLRNRAVASIVRVGTLGDFAWTVSARVYQHSVGGAGVGTFGEHLIACFNWAGRTLTPVGLVAALAGLLLGLLKADRGRRDAVRALAVVATVFAARAALGFVSDNPDAAGYLAPAMVALGVLSVALPVSIWRALAIAPPAPNGPSPAARATLATALVIAPCLAVFFSAMLAHFDTEADRGHAAEVLTRATLDALPPRTVLLAYAPDTIFRLGYAQRVEGERPDVVVVPVALVGYPGATNVLLSRDAALLPLVRDYLAHGTPRTETLLELASLRPMRSEINPMNVRALTSLFIPRGVTAELRSEPTTLAAVRGTAPLHFNAVDGLEQALREEPGSDHEPRIAEFVLWQHYNDAMFFAARGARAEARGSLLRALARFPDARELLGLQAALQASAEGPVDVGPYLVGGRTQAR